MWFDRFYELRRISIACFVLLGVGALFLLPQLKFNFNFEQFFPEGDPDLEVFKDFTSEFETDDNFLLIAVENQPTVFDTAFLKRIKAFSIACKKEVPEVKTVQSLADFKYPVMTPFGPTTIPAVHLNDSSRLTQDSVRIMNDERLLYNLINGSANSTVILLKMNDNIQLEVSKDVMVAVRSLLASYGFEDARMLGRAYFQSELASLQMREIIISTIISGILISIVMILIFKRWISILIALTSIGIGLLIFMGLLSLMGRELTIMAALYPVLMLIVGTSDVVHILTKYLDELKKGKPRKSALHVTIREIGLATLLTSLTTAVGFATLLSSRVVPIQDFGMNSAIGVIIAYVIVIGFTCPLMSLFSREKLIKHKDPIDQWTGFLDKAYFFSLHRSKFIWAASFVVLVFFGIGISKVHTNYDLYTNLPTGEKISEDFLYFEKEYAGFRPLELAVSINENYKVFDYEVLQSVNKAEDHIKSLPEIQTAFSLATIVKSLNQMSKRDNIEAYKFPEEKEYKKLKRMLKAVPASSADILINKDKDKTRISSKIKDIGAQNIKQLTKEIDQWINTNIDTNIVQIQQTGTGLLLDKNSEFVKDSLFEGLLIALTIVSLLMGFLFKNIKMVFLALVPNLIPLLFAASLLGYFNIALEAGVSIVFAIIFGIAVDDTIHFLSKYKLAKNKLGDREAALKVTFQESGKAIIFTTIILFFGFLVLLFSANQPSVAIGMLISVTLFSALIADLTILPVLIRKFKI